MPTPSTTFLKNALPLAALMAVCIGVVISWSSGGLVASLASTTLTAAEKMDAIRNAFEAWGPLAPLAYILFVTAEVVIAPLPGLMLYAPGGIIFGGFWGGLYALTGNVLGAAIACQVMRIAGDRFFGDTLRQRLGKLETLLEQQGLWIILLLRINPLTSSDLVSYAAGLTHIPLWKVLVGTALGMAPLCWLQAYLAEGLMERFPHLIYPLLLASVLYVLVVLWALRKMGSREAMTT